MIVEIYRTWRRWPLPRFQGYKWDWMPEGVGPNNQSQAPVRRDRSGRRRWDYRSLWRHSPAKRDTVANWLFPSTASVAV